MSYAYQNFVTTNITSATGTKEPYMILLKSVLKDAWQKLDTYASFTLYIYLASNRNGFLLGFSPKAISEETGLSPDSVRRAFKKLVDEGFIVKQGGNKYSFYDKSQKASFKPTNALERRSFINDETGQEFKFTYQQLVEAVGNEEEATKLWEGAK